MKQYSFPLIEVDTHTHTIISGHAWSTLTENAIAAGERGMKGLCLTEHGPALIGGAPEYTPHSQRMVPPEVNGIRIYKGIEANIMNPSGEIDIPERFLKQTEYAIASYHSLGGIDIKIGSEDENTEAYLRLMENPWIDVIGHPDSPSVPCDLEALVLSAKKNGKLCELNNNRIASGLYPSGMREFIQLCKKHDQRVVVSSDAHFHTMVGNVTAMMDLLEELDFPTELVVNLKIDRFEAYLSERENRTRKME